MSTPRKTAYLSIGIGLLILVTTSTSVARFAFAQDKAPVDESHSTGGVSKKVLKELSSCQSKAAKDGELTETELDSCYNDSFPGSEPASNTTPQPASNTTPQPASEPPSNTIPASGPNQIAPMNISGSSDLPLSKGTIDEIIKNRFGLNP
ncbi:MAG: hypothetical protein WCA39_00950 [Nitrososphaeraceae archaeon]